MTTPWHLLDTTEVLHRLGTIDGYGLSDTEATHRLSQYGANELREHPAKSLWQMLWEQLTATTVLVLIAAAGISAALRDFKDTTAILAIVIFNTILGLNQEYRAGKAFAALKKFAVPKVRVCRAGHWQELSSRHLVPGDLVLLEAGDFVPADCRLLESINLQVQESAFTGESVPVEKRSDAIASPSAFPTDRASEHLYAQPNCIYLGTVVTYGRGKAVVTETGMATELGKIAHSIQTVSPEQTPLQRRLDVLGRRLAIATLVLVLVILGLGLLRGESLHLMILTSVSIAVAVIPEGLPAVVTIALAIGARRMLSRHALIRKLPAVETLGSVNVICSDKTGTLTENRMTVTTLQLATHSIPLNQLLSPDRVAKSSEPLSQAAPLDATVALLILGSVLCNNTVTNNAETSNTTTNSAAIKSLDPNAIAAGNIQSDARDHSQDSSAKNAKEAIRSHSSSALDSADQPPDLASEGTPLGDPTEIAFVVAATRLGLHKPVLDEALPRIAELPFDSDRKRMTTLHQVTPPPADSEPLLDSILSQIPYALLPTSYVAFTKGAFALLIDRCSHILVNNQVQTLDLAWPDTPGESLRDRIRTAHNHIAQTGARVLLVAYRPLDQVPSAAISSNHLANEIEQELILIGLIGMVDPMRPEAKHAVQTCQQAGIRTVMITGDHPLTAKHIAEELGICDRGPVLTGSELSQLSPADLDRQVEAVSVYARVSPQQKLQIVEALQRQGHIVAMTGDGVNDAPALQKAEIGVAMGITGTDVAKEAADMVLLDDNFATIVAAVQEGRVIYDNIRKFIKYSMTGNASGVWIMLIAPFLAMPLPLLPLQILWINLLADGLLAVALSVEPAERNTMRRPPYPPSENIFSRGVGRDILWVGWLLGLTILLLGHQYWSSAHVHWQTMVFVTLAFSRMSLALAMRSERDSLFKIGLLSNPSLLGAVTLTFILQLAVVYLPALQDFFQTTALPLHELGISLGVSTIGFWAIELEKWMVRRHFKLK